MDYDKNFLDTFNECYPFERYIIRKPKPIGCLFDDAYLTEVFVPNTKIEPILDNNGNLVTFTKMNPDDVYVKLRTKAGEIRLGYFDFASHIREQIRYIFKEDFGQYEYECLYVEYKDTEDLKCLLNEQKMLITAKYGECPLKRKNYVTENIMKGE